MRMKIIFHTPPWVALRDIQVFVKGNFWQIYDGGWAETKTGFCSSSDSLLVRFFLQSGRASQWRVCYQKSLVSHFFIKQTFNVRAEVRLVSNFFWNHPFELIFHKFFPKTNSFSILVTKPLRKIFWRTFFNFFRFLELIHLQNRVFYTNISSNAAETLQFEDLAD